MTVPPATTRRAMRLVAVVIVLAVAGANARIMFGGTWDDVRYHTEISPPRLAAAEAVQGGSLPAWWEGSGLGVPLAGEPSHGALYPPTWIAASPRAFDWLSIVHLMWLALGVAMWARWRSPRPPRHRAWFGDASEPAAIAVALLVATSGLATSAALRGALPALAHLPWVGVAAGWLADAETRRDRARAAAMLGLAIGVIGLSGSLAGLVDALLVAGVLGARRGPRETASGSIAPGELRDHSSAAGELRRRSDADVEATDKPAKRRRSSEPFLIYLVVALAGGLAISAAQWLPAILHLATPHAGAEVSGLPLARLLELVVPTASGSPDLERAIPLLAGDHAWGPSIFVGAPLLALAAVRVPGRRVLVIVGALVVLALVAGRGGWPAWLGAPELHLAALVVVLGAHAGAGLDALVANERRAVLALAAGVGFAVIALIAVAVQRSRAGGSPAFDAGLINGSLGVACGLGALAIVWRGPARAIPAIFALLVIPSFAAGPAIAPAIERSIVDHPPPWAEAIARQPRTFAGGPQRVYRAPALIDIFRPGANVTTPTSKPAAEPAERESLVDAIETLGGASPWRWGIGAARSDDPARLATHDATWAAAAPGGGRFLDRFGITAAIVPATLVTARRFTGLGERGRWALVAWPGEPPAAVMSSWVRAVEPGDAFALMFPFEQSLTLPSGAVVLGEPGDAQTPKDSDRPAACVIEDWSPGTIELQCPASQRGYAVVSSSAAVGWQATVDGDDAHWVTADVLRRAVELRPGPHAMRRVHWTYVAPGLAIGLAIAGIGLALLLSLVLASRR